MRFNLMSMFFFLVLAMQCSYQDQNCRTYLSSGTYSQGGSSGNITSSFDTGTNILTTILTGGVALNQVFTYASRDDFIDEADAVGLQYWLSRVRTGSENKTFIFQFDNEKRPKSHTQENDLVTYTQWDEQGRPTKAEASFSSGTCLANLSYSYDDSARTATIVYAFNAGCSTDKTEVQHFDENMNQVLTTETAGSDFIINIGSTTEICKD